MLRDILYIIKLRFTYKFEKLYSWYHVQILGHNWCECSDCNHVSIGQYCWKCWACGGKNRTWHTDKHAIQIAMEAENQFPEQIVEEENVVKI